MPVVRITSDFVDGDRRVEPEWSLTVLAAKLESVTGIPPESQRFDISSDAGAPVRELTPTTTLAELGIADGWRIHVSDTRPVEDKLDLTADTELKPGMSYEEYAQREDTLLKWKRENHLGRFGKQQPAASPEPTAESGELDIPVGSECFVRLASGKTVRGTVCFYGPASVLPPGPWVGVRLVSEDGLNDGSVKGVRLFEAKPNHGVVVRARAVRPLDQDEEEL